MAAVAGGGAGPVRLTREVMQAHMHPRTNAPRFLCKQSAIRVGCSVAVQYTPPRKKVVFPPRTLPPRAAAAM